MNAGGPDGPGSVRDGMLPVILCCRDEQAGRKVTAPGWAILSAGGDVLDAVEKSVNVAELDPEDDTVGYGGLPNEAGCVQLDACCMYGPTHQAGAVAAIEGIMTPGSVARRVMERTRHIMLVGADAREFAVDQGFRVENLLTAASRAKWQQWKAQREQDAGQDSGSRSHGTINVLGVDAQGNMAGITSTSGLAFKLPGRVGDSPIIGAGLYVDNAVGAAGAIGYGEEVMRICGSFYVVSRMRDGLSPAEACLEGCKRIAEVNRLNGREVSVNVQFTAVNKKGEVGCAAIHRRKGVPSIAFMNPDGFAVRTGPCLFEGED
jgi:N4-(beta-N-acetylglucosaminyl)-L-asparaginase